MTGFGKTPEEAISDLHTVLGIAFEIREQEDEQVKFRFRLLPPVGKSSIVSFETE